MKNSSFDIFHIFNLFSTNILANNKCYSFTEFERIEDYQFECGLKYFTYDPAYPATLTTPVDGEIHIKANSRYGSIVPKRIPFTDDGMEYICYTKVKNITGNGKLSIKIDSTWTSLSFDNGDGVYEIKFTGNLTNIHTGANNDENFEADFEFLSLRLATDPRPSDILTDESGAVLIDDSGAVITAEIV